MAATQSAEAQIAGKVLQGPAGRHVHGIEKAPKPPPRIEDPVEWDRVMRADLAVRDAAREPYLAPARSPLRISRFVAAQRRGRRAAPRGERPRRPARARLRRLSRARPRPVRLAASRSSSGTSCTRRPARSLPAEPPADAYFDAATRWVARAGSASTGAVRRGPRARLPRARRHRPGAHARHRPPDRDRPLRGARRARPPADRPRRGRARLPRRPAPARRRRRSARAARGRAPRRSSTGTRSRSPCTPCASSARGCRRRSRTSR